MTIRLAYVTYAYPPLAGASAHRPLKFSKYLPSFEIDVTVVACGNDRILARDLAYEEEIPRNISVRRIAHPAYTVTGRAMHKLGLFRDGRFPDASAPWSDKVLAALRRQSAQYDVVYVSGPPFSAFGIAAAMARDIPVVLEYRDEWTGSSLLMAGKNVPESERLRELEFACLDAAAHVVTVSREIASRLAGTGRISAERISVVENGYDEDDFTTMPEQPVSDTFTCIYAGYLYVGRSPEWWWRALAELRAERPDVARRMAVTIFGRIAREYTVLLERLGLSDWVRCAGQVDHRDAIRALVNAHLPVIISECAQEASGWPGGKIYECLRSGAPLLVTGFPGSAKDRLLRSCDAGEVVGIDDVQAIKRRILDEFARWQNRQWARRPVPDALRQYERRHLAGQLAALLHTIAGRR